MEDTYTYTARSVDNPQEVVTFTLHGRSVIVDIGVPLEHVERTVTEGEESAPQAWLKPAVVSAMERGTRPFNVADVSARVDDDELWFAAWIRTGGLRLAPIAFNMGTVDNPDAAKAFAKEVRRRKEIVERPGRFPGLLDYWASWIFGSVLMVGIVAIWMWTKKKEEEIDHG